MQSSTWSPMNTRLRTFLALMTQLGTSLKHNKENRYSNISTDCYEVCANNLWGKVYHVCACTAKCIMSVHVLQSVSCLCMYCNVYHVCACTATCIMFVHVLQKIKKVPQIRTNDGFTALHFPLTNYLHFSVQATP